MAPTKAVWLLVLQSGLHDIDGEDRGCPNDASHCSHCHLLGQRDLHWLSSHHLQVLHLQTNGNVCAMKRRETPCSLTCGASLGAAMVLKQSQI